MRKNNKKQIVLANIAKELIFCEKRIMNVLDRATFEIWGVGGSEG